MPTRRTLLQLLAGGGIGLSLPEAALPASEALWLGARADALGRFHASGIDGRGRRVFDLPLPARGHGAAVHPRGHRAVLFARRPGDYAAVIALDTGTVERMAPAAPGRRFNGHGVYSADGRTLYATENAYDEERGVIGCYAVDAGYRRVGEFTSAGLGPHDIRLLGDGRTLVVANGGLLTHPDAPRVELNPATMKPNLAYVSATDGRCLVRVQPPGEWHQLSLRHLALGRDDTVAVAAQYRGSPDGAVPLVALHRADWPALVWLHAPEAERRAMRQYCGSVAFDRGGRRLAVSCPRGNRITLWDPRQRRFQGAVDIADGCGIAPAGSGSDFVVSNGFGELFRLPENGDPQRLAADGGHWDNHLIAL